MGDKCFISNDPERDRATCRYSKHKQVPPVVDRLLVQIICGINDTREFMLPKREGKKSLLSLIKMKIW